MKAAVHRHIIVHSYVLYMYAYVHTVMHMFVLTNWLYNEYNFMRHKTKQRQQNNRPSPTLQARFEGVCVCAWTG